MRKGEKCEMGVADEIKKASHLKAVKLSVESELPNLDEVEVRVDSKEELEDRLAQVAKDRLYAQEAGKKICMIRVRLAQIGQLEASGGSSKRLDQERSSLVRHEQKLLTAGDENMRARIKLALLIEQVRAAEVSKDAAFALLRRLCEERFSEATIEQTQEFRTGMNYPAGSQRFNGRVYLSLFHGEAGQSALEAELRKYLQKVREHLKQSENDAIAAIVHMGDHNLEALREGVVGKYVVHLPERKDPGKPLRREGAALVSVERKQIRDSEMRIIKVLAGAGNLSWLNDHKWKWISLTSFKRGKSDSNIVGDLLKFSDRLIGTLGAGLACLRAGKK